MATATGTATGATGIGATGIGMTVIVGATASVTTGGGVSLLPA